MISACFWSLRQPFIFHFYSVARWIEQRTLMDTKKAKKYRVWKENYMMSFFKIMQFLIPFCQNVLKNHIMVRHNTQHAFLSLSTGFFGDWSLSSSYWTHFLSLACQLHPEILGTAFLLIRETNYWIKENYSCRMHSGSETSVCNVQMIRVTDLWWALRFWRLSSCSCASRLSQWGSAAVIPGYRNNRQPRWSCNSIIDPVSLT